MSTLSTIEINAIRMELLVTQQTNISITGECDSLKQSLRLAKWIVRKTEGQLRQANLKIERLYIHLDGTDPLPSFLNLVPYDTTINFVEQNFIQLRFQASSRLAWLQIHYPFRYDPFHHIAPCRNSHVGSN